MYVKICWSHDSWIESIYSRGDLPGILGCTVYCIMFCFKIEHHVCGFSCPGHLNRWPCLLVSAWPKRRQRQRRAQRPSLKSALHPPPSALAESANFRPFYVKRADFSPPPPATKKKAEISQNPPSLSAPYNKKRRKVVKIRPCGGWWVGGCPPLFA